MKLVASYQANIPVSCEVVTLKIDLPHPRFSWTNTEKQQSPVHDLIELQSDENNYIKQVQIKMFGSPKTHTWIVVIIFIS